MTDEVQTGNEIAPLIDISNEMEDQNEEGTIVVVPEQKEELKVEEQPSPEPEKPQLSEVEQQAIAMGWRPKEEFKGDLSEWKGAKAFVKDKELFDTVHKLNKKLKTQDDVLRKMLELDKKSKEAEITDESSRIKSQIKDAASIGDTETVTKLTDKLVEISKKPVPELPKLDDEDVSLSVEQAANEFTKRNAWFDTVDVKYLDAQIAAKENLDKIIKQYPHLAPSQHFDLLEKKIKSQFSDLFEEPKPISKSAPTVESGANQAEPGRNESYYFNRIPDSYKDSVRYMQRNIKDFDIKEFYNTHFSNAGVK